MHRKKQVPGIKTSFFSKLIHSNHRISLRESILIVFIALMSIITIVIIGVRSIVYEKELTYTASSIMLNVSNNILNELDTQLNEIERLGNFSAQLLQWDVLNHEQFNQMHYNIHLIKMNRLLQGAYLSDMDGNLIYSRKAQDGTIVTEIIKQKTPHSTPQYYESIHDHIVRLDHSHFEQFDPRNRPWFTLIENTHQAGWTDIYPFYQGERWGVTYATPVFGNKKIIGIFALDLELNFLNDFLTKQNISQHGFSFILNQDLNLVAFPNQWPFNQIKKAPHQLINIAHSSLPLISKSHLIYQKTKQLEFEFEHDGKEYLATYQPSNHIDEKWLIGVIAEKNDFTSVIKKVNRITFVICLIFLIFGIALISMIVSRIVKPLKFLIEDTEKIKNFDLKENIQFSSHIKEINMLHDALESMKYGLKQFQKYVPKDLVRQLIETGQETKIGGARKELTCFFSDIENFTTIAEGRDPDELMVQLCEYFEVVSNIILENKGTIDKYIGDSVMAFWGAPIPIKHPSMHAAKAALLSVKAIDELNQRFQKEGKPCFHTRIGIHEGDAIVGNLGSSERLNYTALGDTINIASRLEGINKTYHTHIIVSEAVYENIKETYDCRLLGSVTVKGRHHEIQIYELLN